MLHYTKPKKKREVVEHTIPATQPQGSITGVSQSERFSLSFVYFELVLTETLQLHIIPCTTTLSSPDLPLM